MSQRGDHLRLAYRALAVAGAAAGLAACASGHHEMAPYRAANLRAYEVNGKHYTPKAVKHYEEKGLASWYSYPGRSRRPSRDAH